MLNKAWKMRISKLIAGMLFLVLFVAMVATPAVAASNEPAANAATGGTWAKILLVIVCILLVIAILAIMYLKKKLNDCENSLLDLQDDYTKLGNYSKQTEASLLASKSVAEELRTWQSNALQIDPTMDQKIEQMVNRRAAQNFETQYFAIDLSELSPAIAYGKLNEALTAYDMLEPEIKDYLKINVEEQRRLHNRLEKEYAQSCVTHLRTEFAKERHGTVEDINELDELISFYNRLPKNVKRRIPEQTTAQIRQKRASMALHNREVRPVQSKNGFNANRIINGLTGAVALDEEEVVIAIGAPEGAAEEIRRNQEPL